MLITLWTMLHFVLLALSVVLDPHPPQPLVRTVLLLVVGALVLARFVPVLARSLTRVPASAPNAPPAHRPLGSEVREFRVPGDPGTPGTVLARAPSRLVHASA